LAVLLVAGPALAQRNDLEPPGLASYRRWGFLRARPGFQFADVGYDNNIFASNTDQVGDLTATLAPKLDGLILFGDRAFLTFRERFDYVVYATYPDQNYYNQRFNSRVTVPFDRWGVYADLVWNDIHERPVDFEDVRRLRKERRVGVGAIFELGWRTRVELSRAAVSLDYVDPDNAPAQSAELSRTEQRWVLAASYRLKGRTSLTLDLETRNLDFELDDPDRDSDGRSVYGGFVFGRGGKLAGTARLGWATINGVDPQTTDFSGAVADAELVYRLDSTTRLSLEGERRPGYSIYEDQIYFINTNYRLGAVRFVNRFLGIEAGLSLGTLTFPEGLRRDDLFGYDLGVRLRVTEDESGSRVEYRVRLNTTERSSTDAERDRTTTRLLIDAVFGF